MIVNICTEEKRKKKALSQTKVCVVDGQREGGAGRKGTREENGDICNIVNNNNKKRKKQKEKWLF